MNIHTYGADERLKFCREYLLYKNASSLDDIILLPIPTSRDGKTIATVETVDEICEKINNGCVVVGYAFPKDIRGRFSESGATIVDVSMDEDFLVENAELTAVGTVGRMLSEEKAAPKELSIGIVGYGRIGQRLLRILSFLGADVTVFTSKAELVRELCMLGISAVSSIDLNSEFSKLKLANLDILINTAPAKLIPEAALKCASPLRIIELASGNNFPDSIYCERFKSVPMRMYPKSAGIALGNSILRMLGEADN